MSLLEANIEVLKLGDLNELVKHPDEELDQLYEYDKDCIAFSSAAPSSNAAHYDNYGVGLLPPWVVVAVVVKSMMLLPFLADEYQFNSRCREV